MPPVYEKCIARIFEAGFVWAVDSRATTTKKRTGKVNLAWYLVREMPWSDKLSYLSTIRAVQHSRGFIDKPFMPDTALKP